MRSYTRKKLSRGEVVLVTILSLIAASAAVLFTYEAWLGWSEILYNKAKLAECTVTSACNSYYILSDLSYAYTYTLFVSIMAVVALAMAITTPRVFRHEPNQA